MNSTVPAIWARRGLVKVLTISNLKQTHRNTLLGCLWWLLDPLMMTMVYTIVVAVIRGRGAKVPAYPVFAMCGLLSWRSFSGAIAESINVVAGSEGLIKSFAFPKAVLPISHVLSNQMRYLFSLVPLAGLWLVYKYALGVEQLQMSWALLFVPLIFVAQLILALGGALMFSCFGVFFKDLGNIMSHILRVMWYMSPGLYAIKNVIKGYAGFLSADWTSPRSLYLLNPFAHIMEGYRACIMYGEVPDLGGLAFALLVGILLIAAGLHVFQKQERKFVKFV